MLKPLTAEKFCDPYYANGLAEGVEKVVQAEFPVSFDVVSSRLLEMAGITKNSAKLKARCEYLIKLSKVPYEVQHLTSDGSDEGSNILWIDKETADRITPFYRIPIPGEKPRKAADIAIQEAARAVIDVAEAQLGVPRESLITETAKALGFTRAASNTDCYKLCDRAIDFAFARNALSIDDNGFITPADTNL